MMKMGMGAIKPGISSLMRSGTAKIKSAPGRIAAKGKAISSGLSNYGGMKKQVGSNRMKL
jgi:hypothetical protein